MLKLNPVQRRLFATTEGVLLILFNLAMLLTPIITSALPPKVAAGAAAFTNGLALVSRQGSKAITALAAAIGVKPLQGPAGLPADAAALATALAQQIRSDIAAGRNVDVAGIIEQVQKDVGLGRQVVGDVGQVVSTANATTPPPASGPSADE